MFSNYFGFFVIQVGYKLFSPFLFFLSVRLYELILLEFHVVIFFFLSGSGCFKSQHVSVPSASYSSQHRYHAGISSCLGILILTTFFETFLFQRRSEILGVFMEQVFNSTASCLGQ